jgi:DNA-binding transcriptional LysR family regulator
MIWRMDVRQLRSFIAVAEELNFSRAASRLNISQPSLSQQIRVLETTVRVPLVWRTSRQVELTPAGRAFLDDARLTLRQMDTAVAAAKVQAALSAKNLRLGFVDSAVYGILPPLIRAYRDRYPDVHLSLREMSSLQQIEAISGGKLDIGVLYPESIRADIAFKQLRRERILLAMPFDHPLAKRAKVSLRLLDGEPLVSFEREVAPALYDRVASMLASANAQPRIVQHATELHTVLGMVAAGLGLAFLPSSLKKWAGVDVAYRPLSHPMPWVAMSLAWSRSNSNGLIQSLVGLVGADSDTADDAAG